MAKHPLNPALIKKPRIEFQLTDEAVFPFKESQSEIELSGSGVNLENLGCNTLQLGTRPFCREVLKDGLVNRISPWRACDFEFIQEFLKWDRLVRQRAAHHLPSSLQKFA